MWTCLLKDACFLKKRLRKSNNVWLSALMQSDCLYSSLYFEHHNRISFVIECSDVTVFVCLRAWQSRIKGQGGPGQFLLEGPYDVIRDTIVCKTYVFAD